MPEPREPIPLTDVRCAYTRHDMFCPRCGRVQPFPVHSVAEPAAVYMQRWSVPQTIRCFESVCQQPMLVHFFQQVSYAQALQGL